MQKETLLLKIFELLQWYTHTDCSETAGGASGRCSIMDASATTERRCYEGPCLLSSRIYPEFEDGSCDFINTSTPPVPPPSNRPLCTIPCAQRDFETIFVQGRPVLITGTGLPEVMHSSIQTWVRKVDLLYGQRPRTAVTHKSYRRCCCSS